MLGADPENSRYDGVAVDHHDERKQKHDDQLVPSERDALCVADDVVVDATTHDDEVTFVVM